MQGSNEYFVDVKIAVEFAFVKMNVSNIKRANYFNYFTHYFTGNEIFIAKPTLDYFNKHMST